MIYLGFHNSIDSGAVLMIDGELVGAIHEERLNRIKCFSGFPELSIRYLLDGAGLTPGDVDKVVFGYVDGVSPSPQALEPLLERAISGALEQPEYAVKYKERITSETAYYDRVVTEMWPDMVRMGFDPSRIVMQDHHRCHAAGAYYGAPFDDCLTITLDGKGGYRSSTAWRCRDGRMELLDSLTSFDSCGYFYGLITLAMGFIPHRHEGKVTGLAARGNAAAFRHVTDQMIGLRDGRIHTRMSEYFVPWLADASVLPAFHAAVKAARPEDVAAAAQATLEDVVAGWIESLIERFGETPKVNLALAGGILANVKLNQRIRQLERVDTVYISPAMGDSGLPLGGVLAQMADDGTPRKRFLQSAALGPAFSQDEVARQLTEAGLSFRKVDDIAETLIRLFGEKKPVGFFRGRMEYGPRALCQRTILYDTKDATVNDWMNHKLNRNEFMPFAPVTTAELAPRCFVGWRPQDYSADFMTMVYDCTEEFRTKSPAVVHVDGTARPQIVREEVDPELHAIITRYHAMTGELALVNTSFNNHEEPIVCSVDDAIRSFKLGNVDALLVEGLLVE